MSMMTTDESRTGQLPIPFVEAPVGQLSFDGHEIDVWSIAKTVEGKVIYLNCSAADAALSATLKRLLRRSSGKADFKPAKEGSWPGPTELSKLDEHYQTITQALTYKGLRLKNQCVLPDCANISAGLSRPMEVSILSPSSASSNSASEADGEGEENEAREPAPETRDDSAPEALPDTSCRYVLGDVTADRPPQGAFFAHLKALVVVCHPDWEEVLWEQGMKRGLLLPQPALGIRAWSITRERECWTDLVGELWLAGTLPRPLPPLLPTGRTRNKHHRAPRS